MSEKYTAHYKTDHRTISKDGDALSQKEVIDLLNHYHEKISLIDHDSCMCSWHEIAIDLPLNGEHVLVTYIAKGKKKVIHAIYSDHRFITVGGCYEVIMPVAWSPIPNPYSANN